MNKVYLIFIALFISCKSSPDFLHLNKGMNKHEVIKLVGPPTRTQPIGNDVWWLYEGVQSQVVVMNNDTVKSVLTQQEAASMMKHELDSANAMKRVQVK